MKHGKNYENAAKKIEAGKLYEVNDALALAIETATAKFDETIECHIRLGVDPRSADNKFVEALFFQTELVKQREFLLLQKAIKLMLQKLLVLISLVLRKSLIKL